MPTELGAPPCLKQAGPPISPPDTCLACRERQSPSPSGFSPGKERTHAKTPSLQIYSPRSPFLWILQGLTGLNFHAPQLHHLHSILRQGTREPLQVPICSGGRVLAASSQVSFWITRRWHYRGATQAHHPHPSPPLSLGLSASTGAAQPATNRSHSLPWGVQNQGSLEPFLLLSPPSREDQVSWMRESSHQHREGWRIPSACAGGATST